jgi:predicted TIM-barrel fold metal-dependent hydrolase
MELNDLILFSVDDHLVDPPSIFDDVPASLKDKAPKIISRDGIDAWVYEGRAMPNFALNAVAGRPAEEYGFEPTGYHQMRRGTYDPKTRIDDMNVDGVLASICFPTAVGPAGALFLPAADKVAAAQLISAYNDWYIDVWCAAATARFVPLAIVPIWDADLAVKEAKRVARRGARTISFPDNPAAKGVPSIHTGYWDPLFKVMAEEKMVLSCHIGTGNLAPHASHDAPIDAWIVTLPMAIANAAADWLFSPVFKKFPDLKICLAEGGVGWVPYLLERCDFVYKHHHAWTNSDFGGLTPTEAFHRNFLTCFISDDFGMNSIDHMNVNGVCWECDYPHSDSVWPKSADTVWESVKNLPRESIDKVTHLNAMREFRFDPLATLGRENCTVGALRAQAAHVDTKPIANLGGFDPASRKKGEPVTSGEVMKMFAAAL